jgi:hypothetical protein
VPKPGRIAALLAVTAACGFPRPRDVPGVSDDAGAGAAVMDAAVTDSALADVPDVPGVTLHVSTSGDDANDGFVLPVKTLKHAIGLAAANGEIKNIVLASGRYSTALGETFPYTLPANVTLIGPAGGGAILTGSNAEPGMIVDAGTLRDLELEDFTVAITATGTATVANVHIRTSMLAVRAETAARLTVDNLDVTGSVGGCATGIELNGEAKLDAIVLATRSLGTALNAKDHSAVSISKGNITGDRGCAQIVMFVTTDNAFALSESTLDGGADGLSFAPRSSILQVTIKNTTVRNLKNDGLGGGTGFGGSVAFQMIGGALSDNGRGGAEIVGGDWSFTNVTMEQNKVFGIYFQGDYTPAMDTLTMRGCIVNSVSNSIYLFDDAFADLGTTASPGNNTFVSSQGVGLSIDGNGGTGVPTTIDAVGDVWRPNVQNADANGKYPDSAKITMPVDLVSGNNYSLTQNWVLHL